MADNGNAENSGQNYVTLWCEAMAWEIDGQIVVEEEICMDDSSIEGSS